VNNSVFDIWMMLLFGALGFMMRKWAYEGAPLLLALVLGPKLEAAFRQSLMISHGNFGIFVNRPVSLVFLLGALIFLSAPLLKLAWRRARGAKRIA
jgi:putative tricarboxylic transport membrane protein